MPLQTFLLRHFCGYGSLQESVVVRSDGLNWVLSECRRLSLSSSKTKLLLRSLESFSLNMLQASDLFSLKHIVNGFANV